VLGAAFYAAERMPEAFERLTPEHFFDPVHRRLWWTVTRLFAAGTVIDTTTIAHRMGADEGFAEWGGRDELADLTERADLHAAPGHVDIIADLATRRALEGAARHAAARARDTSDSTGDDILGDLEREAARIAQTSSIETAWVSAGEMMRRSFEKLRARNGRVEYPIGLNELDQRLGGLNAGEVTVVGGFTGMGKTLAAQQIAKGCAGAGIGVSYFSLEMDETPMATRLACDLCYDRSAAAYAGQTTNITIDRALKGNLQTHEWDRFWQAQAIVEGWPLVFDTRPNLTVAQIQAATVRQHRAWMKAGIKPGPVIIDHVGKVKPSQDRRGNLTSETKDVSNDLQAMAKRLGVPVVILSQLNRVVEHSAAKDKRPNLASIKDSGAIVEDARQVILLYRPEYYFREPFEHESMEAKAERLAELEKVRNHYYWIVEKNSNGPRFQTLTYCKADCAAVRDWNI
jgi:replicative DNA helicase